jgi:hypothetical protein
MLGPRQSLLVSPLSGLHLLLDIIPCVQHIFFRDLHPLLLYNGQAGGIGKGGNPNDGILSPGNAGNPIGIPSPGNESPGPQSPLTASIIPRPAGQSGNVKSIGINGTSSNAKKSGIPSIAGIAGNGIGGIGISNEVV